MGWLAKQGEIFTRDNWGPDWICIRFGRYRDLTNNYYKSSRPKKEPKKLMGRPKRIALTNETERKEFSTCQDAAAFLGVKAYTFSRLLAKKATYKGWAISKA